MISVTSFSEAGGHAVSEDAFEVRRHPADPDCWLCVLADGQGGQAGGADAARIACRFAAEAACQLAPQHLSKPSMWIILLKEADAAVRAEPDAGFTTLIGFSIAGDALHGASSGDSAVLVVSGDGIPRQATADQFKNPPVGSGSARFVPFSASLAGRWSVLAMSDGVWK
jgi:PPM family protein phosphatase